MPFDFDVISDLEDNLAVNWPNLYNDTEKTSFWLVLLFVLKSLFNYSVKSRMKIDVPKELGSISRTY